jgi:type VI secretion system protein ImpH
VRLLSDYFEVAVAIVPFIGRWNVIEQDDLTRIGTSGRNQRIGRGALVGGRIWDDQAAIEIRLGPLPFNRFLTFLPIGRSHRVLIALVRFYLRLELDFTVRLAIAAADIPPLKIGKGALLGWTTWLAAAASSEIDTQVVLQGEPVEAKPPRMASAWLGATTTLGRAEARA